MAALIALAILVPTGLTARAALRQHRPSRAPTASAAAAPALSPEAHRPRPTPPSSGMAHACLAALLPPCIAVHLVGSHQLIDTRVKTLTVCLLLAIPLAWAALRSLRMHQAHMRVSRFLTTTIPSCVAVVLLALAPLPTASSRLLEPVTAPPVLPIHFPHDKHTSVNCVICHHNFVDHTGIGSCLDCHRHPRPDLTRSAEATFHTFCRDCHTQLAAATTRHGPTRSCSACHLRPPASG
jgi:hypothetical protein